MFTVFRNTSAPALGKPERESKRGMTNRLEGYRLEGLYAFSLSFQGVASIVSQLRCASVVP